MFSGLIAKGAVYLPLPLTFVLFAWLLVVKHLRLLTGAAPSQLLCGMLEMSSTQGRKVRTLCRSSVWLKMLTPLPCGNYTRSSTPRHFTLPLPYLYIINICSQHWQQLLLFLVQQAIGKCKSTAFFSTFCSSAFFVAPKNIVIFHFESILLDWQNTRAEIRTMSTTKLLVLIVCKVQLFVSLSNNLKGASSLVPLQIIKKIIYLHLFAFQ